ncbi:MAG: four helix bundle protein [Bacteroidota bacterium]
MSKLKRFEELGCWKSARTLTVAVYQIRGALDKDFGLKDQLRRASVSIMNNIAEGFGRFSDREMIRYFEIAHSSANEVRSMFYLLEDLNYVTEQDLSHLRKLLEDCHKQCWGLIKYLKART